MGYRTRIAALSLLVLFRALTLAEAAKPGASVEVANPDGTVNLTRNGETVTVMPTEKLRRLSLDSVSGFTAGTRWNYEVVADEVVIEPDAGEAGKDALQAVPGRLNSSNVRRLYGDRLAVDSQLGLATTLSTMGETEGIRYVYPVLFDRETHTRIYPLDQVVVCLDDVKAVNRLADEYGLDLVKPLEHTKNQFLLKLQKPRDRSPFAIAEGLYADKAVKWAEPDTIVDRRKFFLPNDPKFVNQWHLHSTGQNIFSKVPAVDNDVDAPEAWDITRGDSNLIVAVIDDGLETRHPDLLGNIAPGSYDFSNGDNDPNPENSLDAHGTACAGVIAAIGNNNRGVTGIAPQVRIVSYKIFEGDTYAGDVQAAAAIRQAAITADIMSCSWGGGPGTEVLRTAFEDAVTGTVDPLGIGIPAFVSSGNEFSSTVSFPAAFPETIAVGAINSLEERSSYSNFGVSLDFVAPSSDDGPNLLNIETTDRTGFNGYNNFSGENGDYCNAGDSSGFGGTSSACPLAAGIGALVLSVNPDLNPDQVRGLLRVTSDQVGGVTYTNDFHVEYGYGRVNAHRAVQEAILWRTVTPTPSPTPTSTPTPDPAQNLCPGLPLAIPTQLTGTTTGFSDDYFSCVGSGMDIVYNIQVTNPRYYEFLLNASYDCALYLRTVCDDDTTTIACSDDVGVPNFSSFAVSLQVGTYYLIVDGYTGSGDFTLEINESDPPTQTPTPTKTPTFTNTPTPNGPGDQCPGDTITVPGFISGTTSIFADNYLPTCASGSSLDRIYNFELQQTRTLLFRMEADYDCVLELKDGCDEFAETIECNDDTDGERNISQFGVTLDPGTYYLFVDGFNQFGDYNLSVSDSTPTPTMPPTSTPTVTPTLDPSQGYCPGIPLTVPATVNGQSNGFNNDFYGEGSPACQYGQYADRVYSFTLDQTAYLRFTVDFLFLSGGLYLRSDCADANTTINCTYGDFASTFEQQLSPGTYYLIVDSNDYPEYFYSIELEDITGQPTSTPTNTPTPTPTVIAALNNCPGYRIFPPGLWNNSTENYSNSFDYNASGTFCAGGMFADHVYTFTVDETTNYTFSMTHSGFLFANAGIEIRTTCDDQGTQVDCAYAWPEPRFNRTLNAGDYYLIIDSNDLTSFEYTLTIRENTPTPTPTPSPAGPPDRCPGETVQIPESIYGDTTDFTNDYLGTCSLSDGADLVYNFELTELTEMVFRINFDFEGQFYLQDVCGSSNFYITCRRIYPDLNSTEVRVYLDAGTYYALVDGGDTGGSFSIDFDRIIGTHTPTPTNTPTASPTKNPYLGKCPGIEITPNISLFNETTFGFQSDIDFVPGASCSYGPYSDRVYRFTLNRPSTLRVAMYPDNATGGVYIRDDCEDANSTIVCAYGSGTLQFTENFLPGEYHLIVDSNDTPAFDYALIIWDLTPAATPTPTPLAISHQLRTGWNSFALGMQLPTQDYSIQDMAIDMSQQGLTLDMAANWSEDGWELAVPGIPFSLFELYPGRGYMLRMQNSGVYIERSHALLNASPTWNIKVGWNFVAMPSIKDPYTASRLLDLFAEVRASTVTAVIAFDNNRWRAFTYAAPNDDFALDPHKGYFIYSLEAFTFTP